MLWTSTVGSRICFHGEQLCNHTHVRPSLNSPLLIMTYSDRPTHRISVTLTSRLVLNLRSLGPTSPVTNEDTELDTEAHFRWSTRHTGENLTTRATDGTSVVPTGSGWSSGGNDGSRGTVSVGPGWSHSGTSGSIEPQEKGIRIVWWYDTRIETRRGKGLCSGTIASTKVTHYSAIVVYYCYVTHNIIVQENHQLWYENFHCELARMLKCDYQKQEFRYSVK